MVRTLLWALLGASLLLLLAGCCGNTACDCQDLLADSLYFNFPDSTKASTAFSLHEIRNVTLTRYDSTQSSTTGSAITLPLPRNTRTTKTLRARLKHDFGIDTTGLLIISNNAPFPVASSSSNLSRYVYRLDVPQDSAGTFKKHTFTTFIIDRIKLNGHYQADGCCTCYQNSQKIVRVRGGSAYPGLGQTQKVTESGDGSNRKPVTISLFE